MDGTYQRLSALDAAFLDIETPSSHMHVGIMLLFDTGPLQDSQGGLDIERIRAFVAARLHHIPRYRQRLAYIPLQRHPVWVDDESFNINYHVRHTALPHPGDSRQLKRLLGRINSQKLDRDRPLWEMWFVEGLEDGRFALIGKVHHCMMDGASGVDVMAALLRFDAKTEDPPEPPPWKPRPAPRSGVLLGEEIRRHGHRAKGLFGRLRDLRDDPQAAIDSLKETASNVLDTVGSGVIPASSTPLNPPKIGGFRRFDHLDLDLAKAKAIKRALGGTINDVVLATVAGALRRYFLDKDVSVAELDYRVLMPVNIRAGDTTPTLGNKVSAMLTRLPLEEPDPTQRLHEVTALTREAKESKQRVGAEVVGELGDLTGTRLVSQAMRLATRIRSYNLVVTNMPGPPMPLYLLGARLRAAYFAVPLYLNQALGVAVFSYDGKLLVGLNADWDRVDDLHVLARVFDEEFTLLFDAARQHEAEAGAATGDTSGGGDDNDDASGDQ